MITIPENIKKLKQLVPPSVKIVAVSKTRTPEEILEAYYSGHKIFGENRVQELLGKKERLPSDIEWHLVGHLQSNKAKYIVPFVSLIESVDSLSLLSAINREAQKAGRIVSCLLQIHIAKEVTKYGFNMNELKQMFNNRALINLNNIRICGIMGMATFTDDTEIIRGEFRYLADSFRQLKRDYFADSEEFKEISMGMSGDFGIAIEEGSTIIRIGTLIFGERNKTANNN